MTPKEYRFFRLIAAVAIVGISVTPLVIAFTGSVSKLQIACLLINVVSIVVLTRSWRRMRVMHREWLARRDCLWRSYHEAVARHDEADVFRLRMIMTVWNVEEPR